MPCREPSRPSPDCFTPPNGATSEEMMPSLMPTMPNFQPLRDAPDAADVAGVEVGGEAERRAIGDAYSVVLGLEAEQRRDGAEGLLARNDHVRRDAGQHGWLEEGLPERVALAAQHQTGTLGERVGDVRLDLFHRVLR